MTKLWRVVAFVLSLGAPGAGHFLFGRIRRGIAWAVGVAALGLGLLFAMPVGLLALTASIVVAVLGHVASALDTLRLPAVRARWRIVLVAWAALLVGGSALQGLARHLYTTYYVRSFTIPSAAMTPSLRVGDYILVDRAIYRGRVPRRGDIVVFLYPQDERRYFIKRIIGMPGDQLAVRGEQVEVNGQALDEPYLVAPVPTGSDGRCGYRYGCEPLAVPADSYFVMGDDRENSQDSRHWGFVRREKILGRAFVIYWSWDGDRHALRFDRIGRLL